jgi:hypothetical protein
VRNSLFGVVNTGRKCYKTRVREKGVKKFLEVRILTLRENCLPGLGEDDAGDMQERSSVFLF